MAGKSYSEVVTSPRCREMVQTLHRRAQPRASTGGSRSRSSPSSSKDLTVEDGELTPSLKLRRKVVDEKYRGQLDAHYANS